MFYDTKDILEKSISNAVCSTFITFLDASFIDALLLPHLKEWCIWLLFSQLQDRWRGGGKMIELGQESLTCKKGWMQQGTGTFPGLSFALVYKLLLPLDVYFLIYSTFKIPLWAWLFQSVHLQKLIIICRFRTHCFDPRHVSIPRQEGTKKTFRMQPEIMSWGSRA